MTLTCSSIEDLAAGFGTGSSANARHSTSILSPSELLQKDFLAEGEAADI